MLILSSMFYRRVELYLLSVVIVQCSGQLILLRSTLFFLAFSRPMHVILVSNLR